MPNFISSNQSLSKINLLPGNLFRPVSVAVMRRLDATAMANGLSAEVLMENAGRALAEAVLMFPHTRALVVCGSGNNGGDGLVAARWLIKSGRRVRVVLAHSPENFINECFSHWRALLACRPRWFQWGPAFHCPDYGEPVVDALLGTGLRPPLRPPIPQLIDWINIRRGPKIAADIPSGLDADSGRCVGSAVRADLTVAMGIA
jgi:hydroxyethylthiazole kinase-like uncharacterized protein yjeF